MTFFTLQYYSNSKDETNFAIIFYKQKQKFPKSIYKKLYINIIQIYINKKVFHFIFFAYN